MADDNRLIHAYLTGALSESEAEAFEERLFADDKLERELKRAMEIRAALGDAADVQAQPGRGSVQRVLLPLALAAGAAILAFGLIQLQTPTEVTPVFRGVEQRTGLEVEIADKQLNAQWRPVSDAALYELRLLAADGELLTFVEVSGSQATAEIDLNDASNNASEAAYIELIALDQFGQTIVRSERLEIPK